MDRNTSIDNLTQGVFKSLSARRAWIEMRDVSLNYKEVLVALRKESVDRNLGRVNSMLTLIRRSPQGERG